jgi:hypothetical protein
VLLKNQRAIGCRAGDGLAETERVGQKAAAGHGWIAVQAIMWTCHRDRYLAHGCTSWRGADVDHMVGLRNRRQSMPSLRILPRSV